MTTLVTPTPGQKLLLDFIAQAESGGNFDRVFGDHQTPKPVSQMTISELLGLQAVWGNKFGSSAAGYLQFMRGTLQTLISQGACATSDLFSPALQQSLGVALLNTRGWPRFVTGRLALEVFARNLAMEWASMPVLVPTQGAHRRVAAGETYYAGDRLNRALVPPGAFRAALQGALAAK